MTTPILLDIPAAIETERLLHRPPRAGDGPELYEAVSESLPELRRFLASLPWVAAEQSASGSKESFAMSAEPRMERFATCASMPGSQYRLDRRRLVPSAAAPLDSQRKASRRPICRFAMVRCGRVAAPACATAENWPPYRAGHLRQCGVGTRWLEPTTMMGGLQEHRLPDITCSGRFTLGTRSGH